MRRNQAAGWAIGLASLVAFAAEGSSVFASGDTWETKAPVPQARFRPAAAELDGVIYVVGGGGDGVGYGTRNDAYDVASDTWSSKASISGRYAPAAAALGGKLYLVGGADDSHPSGTAAVDAYDPATNSWSARASLNVSRNSHVLVSVGGRLYAIGGYNAAGMVASTETYDPATNAWSMRAPIPTTRFWAGAAVVDGIIYVVGGASFAANQSGTAVEAYDPVSDTWSARAPLSQRRQELACASLDGVLYAVGGSDGPPLSRVEAYDPATDAWTPRASMPARRAGLVAVAAAGKVFAMAGFDDANGATLLRDTNEAYTPPAQVSAGIVAPASIVQACDADASVATVNFLVEVTGNPPSTATLTVRDVTGGRTLLSAAAVVGSYGVGPNAFPLGSSTVEAKVTDGTTVLASASFAVQVSDTSAPVLLGCEDQVIELAGPLTGVTPASLGVSAADACDPHPAVSVAPSALPLGITTVVATARDASGNTSTRAFDVTVRDTKPPVFAVVPSDVERECTDTSGATVAFDVLATDLSGAVTIACVDDSGRAVSPSGSAYAVGAHVVTCTATDSSGNAASASFRVTVVDSGAPLLVCPADIRVGNDPGQCVARVTFTVTATDACDPSVAIVCTAPWGAVHSGDAFPVGLTRVDCTARDHSGNTATCSFHVLVEDREPPVISAPATVLLTTDCSGTPVTISAGYLGASAVDNCDAHPTLTCSPAALSPGKTSVDVTARDHDGNASHATVSVTVLRGALTCQVLRPLDGHVDNLIRPGQTVELKVRVTCKNVFESGVTATIDKVERIPAGGTPIANQTADDRDDDDSDDDGDAMRPAHDFYVFKLSTKGWPKTSGARFRVTMKFAKAGHVDTFCEVVLKNR